MTTTRKTTTKGTTKKARNAKKAPAKTTQAKPAATQKEANSAEKRLSALDAAAQVLANAKEPMGSKALIEAMAAKGLWTSPGGKTPHPTLYAAMLREINTKGAESRFAKVDRGQFTLNK